MNGEGFISSPDQGSATEHRGRNTNSSELDIFNGDHDFFFLHGNLNLIVPKWERQFKGFLVEQGVAEDRVKTPHLKNLIARYSSWRRDSELPNKSEDSEKAVVIGHSSGANMALVYAEHHPVAGLVLMAPYDRPDVGGSALSRSIWGVIEKGSGMFTKSNPDREHDQLSRRELAAQRVDREPRWSKIVENAGFILVVHTTGDKMVPEKNSSNVFNRLKEASDKLSQSGEDAARVAYLQVEGSGHIPEKSQFSEILSQIPQRTKEA